MDRLPAKIPQVRFLEHPDDQSQRATLPRESGFYRLAYSRNQEDVIPFVTGTPALLNFYTVGEINLLHLAWIDEEIASRIRQHKHILAYLSSALTDEFWTLVHWSINPSQCDTKILILRDPEDPGWNQLALRVKIPRHAISNWMQLWKDLERQIYRRVPSGLIAILVERF